MSENEYVENWMIEHDTEFSNASDEVEELTRQLEDMQRQFENDMYGWNEE